MIRINLVFYYFLILFTGINSQFGRDRNLYEDDMCKPGDTRWICKKLSNCQTGKDAIKKGQWPEICTFDGLEPIVCCPPSSPVTVVTPRPPQGNPVTPLSAVGGGSKARQKCEEYAQYVFRKEVAPVLLQGIEESEPQKVDECARSTETLIVGGVDAMAKEFPHMAQIGYGESPRISWLCGGSLISERFVLSAAHCTKPGSRGPAKWARLGDLDTSTDDDDARTVIARIAERFNHPDYDSIRLYNDIALYKLENDVKLNHYLRPLCLYMDDKKVTKAVATGWGHTEWGGVGSAHLQKVNLKMVEQRVCNRSYEHSVGRQLPRGIDRTTMVCAGDEDGKDTCQGDSGGPLQIAIIEPYCMYAQVGVTSFGKECGSRTPGVYTKVSYYVKWIESVVWP